MNTYRFRLFGEQDGVLLESDLEAASDDEAVDLARIWLASSANYRAGALSRDGVVVAALNKDND